MKKNLQTVLSIAACLLAVICLLQISSLRRQLGNTEGNLSSQIGAISSNVNGISASISSRLEEQASLLSESSWEYSGADYKAGTARLLCSVSPKEYSADTEAFIVINGEELPMTLSDGTFTASADIPLFSETNAAKVLFYQGDAVRTEALDWYFTPRSDYLPSLSAFFSGSGSTSIIDNAAIYHCNGVVTINVDSYSETPAEFKIKSLTLVEKLDGKELGRQDIPMDSAGFFENRQSENGSRPEPAPPAGYAQSQQGLTSSSPVYYELKKGYEIPFGSTLTLYVEAEDENGFYYRCIIGRKEISKSGEPVEDSHWWTGMEASIYDREGKALFEADPELFR